MIKELKYKYFFHKEDYFEERTEGVEIRYWNKNVNELVVEILDDEIGKKCYPILKDLLTKKSTFILKLKNDNFPFKMKDFRIITEKDSVKKIVYTSFPSILDLGRLKESHEKKCDLIIILEKIISMIILNTDYGLGDFNPKNFNSISTFIASLKKYSFKLLAERKSKECLIRYAHYLFSTGGELDSFYDGLLEKGVIYKSYEFPYGKEIIKLCYGCYRGDIPDEGLRSFFEEEKEKYNYKNDNRILASFEAIHRSNCNPSFEGINITVFEEKYNIFRRHIIKNGINCFLDDLEVFGDSILEKVGERIYDLEGNIIGFVSKKDDDMSVYQFIKDIPMKSEKEIYDILGRLEEFFSDYLGIGYDEIPYTPNFDLEKDVVICNGKFELLTAAAYLEIMDIDIFEIKKQIARLFISVYSTLIKNKYGEDYDISKLRSLQETKYLDPDILDLMVDINNCDQKMSINNRSTVGKIIGLIKKMQYIYSLVEKKGYQEKYHIPKYLYDEIEEKYGKCQKGTYKILSEDRMIMIFKDNIDMTEFIKGDIRKREEIPFKFGDKVTVVELKGLIFSNEIQENSYGLFTIAGVIVSGNKGEKLEEAYKKANNKEFYTILGKIYPIFFEYLIENGVYIDGNYNIYANIYEKGYIVKDASNYFEKVTKAYSPLAMLFTKNITIPKNPERAGEMFSNISKNLNSYCKMHKIYYNHKKKCPLCREKKVIDSGKYFISSHQFLRQDKYASYYRGKDVYYKIYNPQNVDMKQAEMNLTEIVIRRLLGDDLSKIFKQDCFIPQKLLYNLKKQFIGYTYQYSEEVYGKGKPLEIDTEKCINLETKEIPNVNRAKLLLKASEQILDLIGECNGSFKCNPFTDAFLIKDHKAVQFPNIELFDEKMRADKRNESIRWLIEYITRVVEEDDTMYPSIDIRNMKIDSLTFSQVAEKINCELANFVERNTNFCKIHQMYYDKDQVLCPKCLKNYDIPVKHMDLKKYISKSSKIGMGGEAKVYKFKENLVVKVFNEKVNISRKAIVLAKIFSKKSILEEQNKKKLKYYYVLPEEVIKTDKQFAYTMQKVEGNRISVLRDIKVVKNLKLTKKDILEILITVGEGIEFLHEKANITIGDLNGGNIVFDKDKNVYFIDFDGMGIDEIMPVAFTTSYIDPVSEKNNRITMKDDWYSFAIHAFYYLTHSHPFSGIYKSGEVNGVALNMPISVRMEKRISLLGNHGVELPEITETWEWMDKQLINKFLAIFEGDDRTSILPMLKVQYKKLGGYTDEDAIRINETIVAEKMDKFQSNIKIFNSKAALCHNSIENKLWIHIFSDKYGEIRYYPNDIENVGEEINEIFKIINAKDVLIDEENGFFWIIYPYGVTIVNVYHLETETVVVTNEIQHYVMNEKYLYVTTKGEKGITKINTNGERRHLYEKSVIKNFLIKKNSKIITIREDDEDKSNLKIFCNSEEIWKGKQEQLGNARILYDKFKNIWCIVSSEKWGIEVNSKIGIKQFKIEIELPNNLENIEFANKTLYVMYDGHLKFLDIDDQRHSKELECVIFRDSSKLCDMDADGVTVITENKMYRICEG